MEINWSSHILLIDGIEEKDRSFWLELCAKKKYSVRKLKEKVEKWNKGILFRPGNEIVLLQLDEIEEKKTHIKYTFDKNTYVIPTQAELDKMKETDIQSIHKNELVDINNIIIDESLPKYEPICSFLEKVKNPYCFKVGDVAVKIVHTEDGPTFEELIEQMITRQIEQETGLSTKCYLK